MSLNDKFILKILKSECSIFITDILYKLDCNFSNLYSKVLDSIVVSIPACHAGDRGSIPRRGDFFSPFHYVLFIRSLFIFLTLFPRI